MLSKTIKKFKNIREKGEKGLKSFEKNPINIVK
jgi:hypothetical protein